MSPKWDRQKDSGGSRPRFLPGSHGGGGGGTGALEFAINMQRRSEEEEGALLFWEWNGGRRPREDTYPLLSSPIAPSAFQSVPDKRPGNRGKE